MARFLKHVGKHGDRKVAVIFRQVPGDEHMCLVVYTELLNSNIHDPLIACIESAPGQSTENLADALNRVYTKDGQVILQILHREGLLKRVQTDLIMMTPAPNQKIKLSELNSILNEMAKGEEAVRRLAEIDASRGLQDPKDVAKRMRGESTLPPPPAKAAVAPAVPGVLGDTELATNLRAQAIRMANEAESLMAESKRLLAEAETLSGVQPAKKSKKAAQAPATVEAPPAKAKRTQAKKAVVAG